MIETTILATVAALRERVAVWRADGQRVALVPTMGALHDGHISLTEVARRHADRVIVSIFVNPTQFGPNEDFDAYPRTFDADMEKLRAAGVDAVYRPSVQEMYPDGFATTVTVSGLTDLLCGAARPGHFDGVGQVVSKLLLQALPDAAVFGEKDYQQLMVIRRVVADLNIPVEVVGAPILRETDGLAMSSRNRYLTAEERAIAPVLNQSLLQIAAALRAGRDGVDEIETARTRLSEVGFTEIDYLDVRDATDLSAVTGPLIRPARVFGAARLGKARLIDNVPV